LKKENIWLKKLSTLLGNEKDVEIRKQWNDENIKHIYELYEGISVYSGKHVSVEDVAFVKKDKNKPYVIHNVVPVNRFEVRIVRKPTFSWNHEQIDRMCKK
jgi:hypothetical protein